MVWRLDDPNGDEQGAHEQNKRTNELLSIEIGITHRQFQIGSTSGEGAVGRDGVYISRRASDGMPRAARIPAAGAQHDADDREHDRHFDQDANDGGESGAGLKAEQSDRGGDRQLEKFEAPIKADGQATLCGTPSARFSP